MQWFRCAFLLSAAISLYLIALFFVYDSLSVCHRTICFICSDWERKSGNSGNLRGLRGDQDDPMSFRSFLLFLGTQQAQLNIDHLHVMLQCCWKRSLRGHGFWLMWEQDPGNQSFLTPSLPWNVRTLHPPFPRLELFQRQPWESNVLSRPSGLNMRLNTDKAPLQTLKILVGRLKPYCSVATWQHPM